MSLILSPCAVVICSSSFKRSRIDSVFVGRFFVCKWVRDKGYSAGLVAVPEVCLGVLQRGLARGGLAVSQ